MPELNYISHNDIDFIKWDKCIAGAINENIYGYSWYLDAVADSKWDAVVLGDYQAVFPLPYRRKLGIHYIYQPFFCQQLGLYASDSKLTQDAFFNAISKRFLRIHLQVNNAFPTTQHAKQKPNYVLDLSKSYTDLKAGFKADAIKNLKKCSKAGINYSIETPPETIIKMHRQTWGNLDSKLGDREYGRFLKVCQQAQLRGCYCGIRAELNGDLLGAAIFLKSEKRVHYMVSGPTDAGRKHSVMHGIIDCAIKTFSGQPLVLDFEGSSIPEVALFYEKWGSKKTEYSEVLIRQFLM